jgi:hypothetical protein
VINRWHGDALDQVNYPLPIEYMLGENGLYQTGLAIDLALPECGGATQDITLQLTNPDNDHLFSGDTLGTPTLLAHYTNFRDLSRDTYLEFGLSGLFGWNDEWTVEEAGVLQTDHDALGTIVAGADLTFVWEPAARAKYRNIEWRSEVFALHRDILAPDGSGRDGIHAYGAFSYVQAKITQSIHVGIRGDIYVPDSKDYARTHPTLVTPFAADSSTAHVWQVAPYITWWQSEFVRFRCEYNHINGHGLHEPAHVVWLQVVFAAGPHKHERY